MRNKIIETHQFLKLYKTISEALGLQCTTVRVIIHRKQQTAFPEVVIILRLIIQQ